MAGLGFHSKPFDEGTLTKLQIFQLYTREWLPVFLANSTPLRVEIHIFDFFSGPGSDPHGNEGSPLRILRELRRAMALPGWRSVRIYVHFFDKSPRKIRRLREKVESDPNSAPNVELDIRAVDFADAFAESRPILRRTDAAKLLFLDQFGVDCVTPSVFGELLAAPAADFLFFISSSTLHRFRDHPAIKQKIRRPDDPYHVHRAVLDYYRNLLPQLTTYHLAPFSIKKGGNIYGLIFGSAHPLGLDKFLQVAWKTDELNGEADFDIHRDNLDASQPKLFRPTKLGAFEEDLEHYIRTGVVANEADVIEICFKHGVLRQHATPILTELKASGALLASFSVPDIRRFRRPRPVRFVGGTLF